LPSSKPQAAGKTTGELTAWREPAPALAARNLGLALFQTGGSARNGDAVYRSYQILARLPQRDPTVLATLGSILLQQNHPDVAVTLYKQATTAEPRNARYAYILGVALNANGDRQAAIAELRRSIELDPSVPDAYRKLSEIYDQLRQYVLAKQVLAEYLKFMPQNITLRRVN
ncbi:MAG: tetratricopeptide repeat protein, partial [Bryobacteraceae bacterium]